MPRAVYTRNLSTRFRTPHGHAICTANGRQSKKRAAVFATSKTSSFTIKRWRLGYEDVLGNCGNGVLGWAVMAQAGPLEIKDVPANAKWVAHADLDAAHSSQVVQSFVQQCSKDFPRAKEKVIEFCHRIGWSSAQTCTASRSMARNWSRTRAS